MSDLLDLNVLQEVALFEGDTERPLVSSRKLRALLAYLAVTGETHNREHLCEMFFHSTVDPRGGLRWSLSKLRGVLDGETQRLITDKKTVKLQMEQIRLDFNFIQQTADAVAPTTSDLMRAALLLSHRPLEHLKSLRSGMFQEWLTGELDMIQDARARIITKLTSAHDVTDEVALKWLQHWVRLAPKSHDAAYSLWQHLKKAGQDTAATEVATTFRRVVGDRPGAWYGAPVSIRIPPQLCQKQTIGYCITRDGVRLAHASVGQGPPLVKTANWLHHLNRDWNHPIWRDTFAAFAKDNTLIRYDERGNGLSDWHAPDISFSAYINDLEAVVDNMDLTRFPLLGMSLGCAVSIAYAARHPERVSSLILIGGHVTGPRRKFHPKQQDLREAVINLMRNGLSTADPAYRKIFANTFMPDAERLAWFDKLQFATKPPECAVPFQEAHCDIDVRRMLRQIRVPTLIVHPRNDPRYPIAQAQQLVAGIPNVELVTLDKAGRGTGLNTPSVQSLTNEIGAFLRKNTLS